MARHGQRRPPVSFPLIGGLTLNLFIFYFFLMKTSLLLVLLVLAGCGSPSAPAADPRIAQIQAQHKQLLALKAPFSETENQILELEKEVKKLPNSGSMELDKGLPERHRQYAEMVAASEAAMGTLNQLDPAKSQDAAQAQLVGQSLEREQAMVKFATALVEKNRTWIGFFQKTAAFRNSQKGH